MLESKFSPNGSHEQALIRGMVWSAKFLLLQHLSRDEQRQGSVGGAKHGIENGTGIGLAGMARDRSSEGLSGLARGGIEGDLAACPETRSAHCVAAREQSRFGIHFAATGKVPLDPPIPPGAAVLATAERLAAIDPLWSAKGPV
jgi:hypothetical protein